MDRSVYLDLNRLARHTAWLHSAARVYAIYGGVALLALVAAVVFLRARSVPGRRERIRRQAGAVWSVGAAAAAVGIAQPIAHLVGRPRPYWVLHRVEVLVPKAHDFSFPSDHATYVGGIVVGLWIAGDRLGAWLATFLGLLLAVDRVYVGAHWPSDVLAGLALGATVAVGGWPVARPIARACLRILEASPLAVLARRNESEPRLAMSTAPRSFRTPDGHVTIRRGHAHNAVSNVVRPQEGDATTGRPDRRDAP
jgi:undecaprenyl-diphosphatase